MTTTDNEQIERDIIVDCFGNEMVPMSKELELFGDGPIDFMPSLDCEYPIKIRLPTINRREQAAMKKAAVKAKKKLKNAKWYVQCLEHPHEIYEIT